MKILSFHLAAIRALGILGFFLSHLASAQDSSDRFQIAQNGKAMCAIVVKPHGTRSARFAACELRWHLRKITGADIPILDTDSTIRGNVIYVGDGPWNANGLGIGQDNLSTQEYVIDIADAQIRLYGKDSDDLGDVKYNYNAPEISMGIPDEWTDIGSMYAVYDFLETTCGIHWYSQTEFGMYIPDNAMLAVEKRSIRDRPSFIYRDACYQHPQEYDRYASLWGASGPELLEWQKQAYPSIFARSKSNEEANRARTGMAKLFLLRNRCGGVRLKCNHSLNRYYDRFLESGPNAQPPPEGLREEFFAKGYGASRPPQLCYSNPALIQQVARDAIAYYNRERTGKDLVASWLIHPNPYPIEPMDSLSFCKCDACLQRVRAVPQSPNAFAGSQHSDYIFRFIDDVAKEIHKTKPTADVIALSYASHAGAPSFQMDPLVNIQFCFTASWVPYSSSYTRELEYLSDWAAESKRSNRMLGLWLYYGLPTERANKGKYHCFPGFMAHEISTQMKLFKAHGVYGMFNCGLGSDIDAYFVMRLMNHASVDIDKVIHEYFSQMFGGAGSALETLYRDVERVYCSKAGRNPEERQSLRTCWGVLGTNERMARWGGLIADAESQELSTKERSNVRLFKLGIWDYMTSGRLQYEKRLAAAITNLTAQGVDKSSGDPLRVDWSKQNITTYTNWYEINTDVRSKKSMSVAFCYDADCLYIKMHDACDQRRLVSSADVFPSDNWEIYVAAERSLPFRQFAVGPTGMLVGLSHGEENFRVNVPIDLNGVRAICETANGWTTYIAIPRKVCMPAFDAWPKEFYINIIRSTSQKLNGGRAESYDSIAPFSGMKEPDGFSRIHLADIEKSKGAIP